ncbi:MAG: isoprenyl transferase [Chloroflexota bacterium]|jgi:undecaprenyl diphosphate synthase
MKVAPKETGASDDGIKEPKVPYHVAIIMDGNGRWAQRRGLPRVAGHKAGTDNLKRVLEAAVEHNVKVLTIYAFSTENWRRPQDEVKGLMSILLQVIDRESNNLHRNGVQVRHVGSLEGIDEHLRERIQYAVNLTKNNDRIILNVAFNYGGRAEIVQAVRRIMQDGIPAESVTEELIGLYLYTSGLPDPDLIIRTGGEMRLSNFLLWQAAYAEYYSTPVFWPDFSKDDFHEAIEEYGRRHRRFGALGK